jgi:hypothetical protein
MRRCAFALLLLPAILSAQAILQHTIAAGAGTAAGAILGKQVSKALDVVQAAAKEAEGIQPSEGNKRNEWKRWVTGPRPERPIAPPAEEALPPSPVRRNVRPAAAVAVSPA